MQDWKLSMHFQAKALVHAMLGILFQSLLRPRLAQPPRLSSARLSVGSLNRLSDRLINEIHNCRLHVPRTRGRPGWRGEPEEGKPVFELSFRARKMVHSFDWIVGPSRPGQRFLFCVLIPSCRSHWRTHLSSSCPFMVVPSSVILKPFSRQRLGGQ